MTNDVLRIIKDQVSYHKDQLKQLSKVIRVLSRGKRGKGPRMRYKARKAVKRTKVPSGASKAS